MLYILLLIVPALGLTDDEIAMFSPEHYPPHVEINTGMFCDHVWVRQPAVLRHENLYILYLGYTCTFF